MFRQHAYRPRRRDGAIGESEPARPHPPGAKNCDTALNIRSAVDSSENGASGRSTKRRATTLGAYFGTRTGRNIVCAWPALTASQSTCGSPIRDRQHSTGQQRSTDYSDPSGGVTHSAPCISWSPGADPCQFVRLDTLWNAGGCRPPNSSRSGSFASD